MVGVVGWVGRFCHCEAEGRGNPGFPFPAYFCTWEKGRGEGKMFFHSDPANGGGERIEVREKMSRRLATGYWSLVTGFLVLLFLASPAWGYKPHLGFRLGISSATQTGNSEAGGSNFGICGSVLIENEISKHFRIQPEVGFITKGWSENTFLTPDYLDLDYIDIPILLKLVFGEEARSARLGMYIGPAVGILRSGTREWYEGEIFGGRSVTSDVTGDFQSIEYGIVMGFEAGRKRERCAWVFDVRYERSLYSIALEEGEKVINHALSFAFGFLLDLEKPG